MESRGGDRKSPTHIIDQIRKRNVSQITNLFSKQSNIYKNLDYTEVKESEKEIIDRNVILSETKT